MLEFIFMIDFYRKFNHIILYLKLELSNMGGGI